MSRYYMFDRVLSTPMIMSKNIKNESKKEQPQKQHYVQHRELVSLLFRFPKPTLLSFFSNSYRIKKVQSFLLLLLKNVCQSLNF